jgi:hypothetical protein
VPVSTNCGFEAWIVIVYSCREDKQKAQREDETNKKEALLFVTIKNNRVCCDLWEHPCLIAVGKKGVRRAHRCRGDGKLIYKVVFTMFTLAI